MAYKHNKAWRRKNPRKWQAEKKKNYGQTGGAKNNENWFQRWTSGEDKLILRAKEHPLLFDRKLHRLLGRSVQSIQYRRCILKGGLIEEM